MLFDSFSVKNEESSERCGNNEQPLDDACGHPTKAPDVVTPKHIVVFKILADKSVPSPSIEVPSKSPNNHPTSYIPLLKPDSALSNAKGKSAHLNAEPAASGNPIVKPVSTSVSKAEDIGKQQSVGSVCPFCKDQYGDVVSHIIRQHQFIVCPHCNKRFGSQDEAMKHTCIAAKHSGPFQCNKCNCSFAVEIDFKHHQATHSNPIHRVKCRECRQRFYSKSLLDRHMDAHHPESNSVVSADNFMEGVGSIVEVETESDEIDESSLPQKKKDSKTIPEHCCQKCKKEFNLASELAYHIRTVHSLENIKKVTQEAHSIRAKKEKPRSKLEKCPFCGNEFFDLKCHISQGHLKTHRFHCKKCNIKFISKSALHEHTASKHNDQPEFLDRRCAVIVDDLELHEVERDDPSNTSVYCQKCKNGFSSVSSLIGHSCVVSKSQSHTSIQNAEEKFKKCPFCDNKYLALKHHIARMHKRKLKYPCSQCDLKFIDPIARQRHISSNHNGPRFLCYTCGHSFPAINNLKNHEITHGERNLVCDYCESKFKEKYTLAAHCRQHGDIRPYKCNYCKMRFRQTVTRRVHQIRKHTNEFPILCHSCGEKFIFPSELRDHRSKNGCQ